MASTSSKRGRFGRYRSTRRDGFRSTLEHAVARALDEAGREYTYEAHKVPYTRPASHHTYTPDLVLPNGIVVEVKGYLVADSRKAIALVRAQHPALDVRFVVQNPKGKVEGLKITIAEWCIKFDIPFAVKAIPEEWLVEPVRKRRVAAIERFRK